MKGNKCNARRKEVRELIMRPFVALLVLAEARGAVIAVIGGGAELAYLTIFSVFRNVKLVL